MKATRSIWSSFSDIHDYPALKENISADVAVIGGGITGISTAKLLAQRGVNVVVLESMKVGGGTSSHSTGNLYFTIDNILSSLQSKYNIDVIRDVADSRAHALKQMGDWISEYGMDCDYREVPWYLYSSGDEESGKKIEGEFKAGQKAGLSILKADGGEIPFMHEKAIKIPRQNQINPMRYVQELAQTLRGDRCQIYEQTHVSSVEEQDGEYLLKTSGAEVRTKYVVHATHTPKGIMMVQTLLGPYREYGIACRVDESPLPDGIYWGYHSGKKFSTRNYSRGGKNFLIVVGESHKVGQAENNAEYIRNLEKFAEEHFDFQKVDYRWGGQHYRPADLLPYIGPRKKNSGEFIATGYSTDGLVYGTLAGMILSDHITGRKNSWSELYSSTRSHPLKAAPKFLKENIDVAKKYMKNLPGLSGDSDVGDLKKGEGRIVEKEGEKLAVYRQEDGKLEVVSAVCSHMSCIVNWNNAEQSWDCPCHGSRFKTDGTVLEGPAYEPLQNVDFEDKAD